MAALARLTPAVVERGYPRTIQILGTWRQRLPYSTSGENGDNGSDTDSKRPVLCEKDIQEGLDDLEEPTNCCMSGCANCVWIRYAEKLSEKLADSDADIQKIIIDKVQDPNMKAFLSMELRCRKIC